MRIKEIVFGLTVLSGASAAAPVVASDHSWEFRAGAAISGLELGGPLYSPNWSTVHIENLDTLDLDLIYVPPDLDVLMWLGSPRLELGGLINLRGRESLVHAGVNWHVQVFDSPLFLEFGLGGAAHNGYASNPPPGFRDLGCNLAFHYSYAVGVDVAQDWTLVGKFQHISQAGLCGHDHNQGINNVGVELGHKF